MKSWHRIARKLDARAPRERILIAVTVFAILVFLTDQFALRPLTDAQTRLERDRRTLGSEIEAQNEEMGRLRVTLASNPNDRLKREIARLTDALQEVEQQITQATLHLVDPGKMAEILEQVLERGGKLRLVGLENLGPQPIEATPDGQEPDETTVYRHGLRIELQGTFHDALGYLERLETLPWGFFWNRLEIIGGEYPQNRISIEVYTISVGRRWLGV